MQHTLGHWNLWKCEWNYEPQLVQVSRKRQVSAGLPAATAMDVARTPLRLQGSVIPCCFSGNRSLRRKFAATDPLGSRPVAQRKSTCGSWVQYSVDRVLGRTTEIAAPGIWHRGDWPVQRNSPTRAGLGRARRIWRSAVLVEKMQTRFWVALWFLSGHTESVVRRLTPMLRPADRGRNQRSD